MQPIDTQAGVPAARGGFFEQLGIYGLGAVETVVLAGLAGGEPVLLVGGHGSAKTALCGKIAASLGLRYWAYDAGKALFEDILGFPNPKSLDAGEIDYIPSPISIWGKEFVLIDELSRAAPAMQNKWLEVIRSRQIMGKKLPDLKYVVAAMNPPAYLGAHPLDEALAGRFAVIVAIPDVNEMSADDRLRVITNVTADDDPLGLRPVVASEHKVNLGAFLEDVRARVAAFPAAEAARTARYVAAVGEHLASYECPLDGRRQGMLFRTLKAALGVEAARRGAALAGIGDVPAQVRDWLPHLLPFGATGRDVNAALVQTAHQAGLEALRGEGRRRVVAPGKTAFESVVRFAAEHRDVPLNARSQSVTRLLATGLEKADHEGMADAAVATSMLAGLVAAGTVELSVEDQYRVLDRFRSQVAHTGADQHEFAGALNDLIEGGLTPTPLEITAARLAFRRLKHRGRFDRGELQRLTRTLLNRLLGMQPGDDQ